MSHYMAKIHYNCSTVTLLFNFCQIKECFTKPCTEAMSRCNREINDLDERGRWCKGEGFLCIRWSRHAVNVACNSRRSLPPLHLLAGGAATEEWQPLIIQPVAGMKRRWGWINFREAACLYTWCQSAIAVWNTFWWLISVAAAAM